MAKNRNNLSPSAAVRARLDHPVIDGDGHIVEMNPVLLDYLNPHFPDELVNRCPEMEIML